MQSPSGGSRPILKVSGIVIALIGLGTAAAGAWLLSLGGSWYYLIAGLGTAVAGLLLLARRPEALWAYALVVLGTVAWAIYEIGLDWWPLAARGDVVFLIGLWLLMPWISRGLGRRAVLPLAASLLVGAVVGVAALLTDDHDRPGDLPAAAQGATPPKDYAGVPDGDWRAYGRSNYGDRYSPLTQITPDNVAKLQPAWTFHTGDIRSDKDPLETTYEVTPLKVGDTVYLCTPHDIVVALDAETGQQRWRFDPQIKQSKDLQHLTCRGVSYHEEQASSAAGGGECARRIFIPTADARLMALDAGTGKPCAGFGKGGEVDLWEGMPELQPGYYYSTSPPVTTRDVVIIAGNVSDNISTSEPSGVIRGYDVRDGHLIWNWDAGNPDQTAPLQPGQRYTRNSPNSWSTSSADEALGLVYVPMGNQTPDEWGGNRQPTPERFNSSIVALDIATGRLRWVYQTVHHDLWDMDIGGQPSLIDLDTAEGKRPALVASTKRGDLYVLDRRTGEPIVPVTDRQVPQGAAPGDRTSPTQPFSALTFLPQRPVVEADMWGATMFDQLACRIEFRRLRYEGIFTPPSVQGTLVFPGNFGIFDWGGIAVDPLRQVAFTNPDYMAFVSRLIPREAEAAKGEPESKEPSGGNDLQTSANETGINPQAGTPFAVELKAFLSPLKLPCQAPPWGYVAGVDLKGAKVMWQRKNGTIRDNSPVPVPIKMGVPSLGGPIMTAGGVAFLTSTLDYYVRAYDVTSGRQLWEDRLPAGGQATPMTYRSDASGRQFVIVVAGGHGSLGTKAGDSVIAYALPKG